MIRIRLKRSIGVPMNNVQKVNFQSHGSNCCANYYEAASSSDDKGLTKHCIVMAHGLAGVKEMRLGAYAERFSEAGYDVLVFDYRHFGESEGQPRQILDIKKQHQDWISAVEFASKKSQVPIERIILWGSSLSGGHVMAVADKLPKVAAVIAQVPHVNGIASAMMSRFVDSIKLSTAGIIDCVKAGLGLAPFYVKASGEPGELALMTAPGESSGYHNLVPDGVKFDDRVAARFVLAVTNYNPGKKLKSLNMPILVQVGLNDVTTPPRAAIKDCNKAKTVTLKTYATGHFEPYVDPLFSTIVGDQLAFLDSVVANK